MEFETTLLQSIDRGAGCMSFRFQKPVGYAFQAGQYFLLRLEPRLMKPFSFSNSPTESGYLELTTKMSESDYKKKLASLQPGGKVKVSSPLGKFTYNPSAGKAVFLAGGIGITPFRSIMKHLADTRADCDCILLWGVNTLEDAIFKADFDSMNAENPVLRAVYVPAKPPADWAGRSGFITAEIIAAEAPDHQQRVFYVCGPPKMVEVMGKLLSGIGIGTERIVVEQFGGY